MTDNSLPVRMLERSSSCSGQRSPLAEEHHDIDVATPYNTLNMVQSLHNVSKGCEWLSQNPDDVSNLCKFSNTVNMEEIAVNLVALACDLRTLRNTSVAINKLPPEILSYIFGMITDHWRFLRFLPASGQPGTFKTIQWPQVTMVCRHWRSVALGQPNLWSLMKVRRGHGKLYCAERFLDICLQRSGQSPLTVYCDTRVGSLNLDSPFFTSLVGQTHRIRDLRIVHHGSLNTIPPLLDNALQLTTLAVQVSPAVSSSSSSRRASSLTWKTPNVQNLMVEGCYDWLHKPWKRLQHLCIGHQVYADAGAVETLLGVLFSCRATLEELVLYNVFMPPDIISSLEESHQDIELTHLRRVVLENLAPSALVVLSARLDLPEDCAQQISGNEAVDWSHILRRSSSYSPQRLLIDGSSRIGVNGPSAFFIRNSQFDPRTLPLIPLDTVTELWLTRRFMHTKEPREVWQQVFGRMQDVQKLVFMDFLDFAPKTRFVANCFPRLVEFHILHHFVHLLDLDQLLDFLRRRRKLGYTIPKLIIWTGPLDHRTSTATYKSSYWLEWAAARKDEFEVITEVQGWTTKEGSVEMKIPDICRTESSVKVFWDPELWLSCLKTLNDMQTM